MPSDLTSQPPRPKSRRWLLLILAGTVCFFLSLAYSPPLADYLESLLFVQPAPEAPPPTNPAPDLVWESPGIRKPLTLSADKAALDDDTPVIGVLVSGHARAYLVEALEHGPASHVVNDVLGGVPISVTHCEISGCTRVFTAVGHSQPLELSVEGRRNRQLILKFGGRLYLQTTSAPLDEGGSPLPCSEYPAERTAWKAWRQAHPQTDVYMGSVDEATPPEAGGPQTVSPPKTSSPTHHSS